MYLSISSGTLLLTGHTDLTGTGINLLSKNAEVGGSTNLQSISYDVPEDSDSRLSATIVTDHEGPVL